MSRVRRPASGSRSGGGSARRGGTRRRRLLQTQPPAPASIHTGCWQRGLTRQPDPAPGLRSELLDPLVNDSTSSWGGSREFDETNTEPFSDKYSRRRAQPEKLGARPAAGSEAVAWCRCQAGLPLCPHVASTKSGSLVGLGASAPGGNHAW